MITLDAIPIGKSVRMVGFRGMTPSFRHQLLAMGLTPGVIFSITQIAPLGDPIQIQLRGFTLSLRKNECQQIEVEYAKVKQQSCDVSGDGAVDHCACRGSQ